MIPMKLDSIYFDLIKSGKKIYETRVFDTKRQKLKLLDVIEFTHRETKEKMKGKILELAWFPDFREAISSAGLKKVMPNARSIDDAVNLYEKFPHDEGSYQKGAKKFGVLRIKFMLVS
jgi:ASC-1-like (ASCH) protein